MVTFELFVRPVLRRMLGHERLFRRAVRVVLEEPVTIGARADALSSRGRHAARRRRAGGASHRRQGSGILTSMSLANALLVVPDDRPRCEIGETLNAILLGEEAHLVDAVRAVTR